MTDAALHLSTHELLALARDTPAEGTATTLELLGLSTGGDEAALLHAGRATLLVRGLAQVQDARVLPVAHCAVVGTVLGRANDWLDVTLATPHSEHLLLLAGSPVGAVLLSRGPYGVYEITPVAAGPALLTLAGQLAEAFLGAAAAGTPATALLRRVRTGQAPTAAQLTVSPTGEWTLRHGPESATSGAVAGAAVVLERATAQAAVAHALA